MSLSLWSSSQERTQRIKHSLNIFALSLLFFFFLSLANISTFSNVGVDSILNNFFSSFAKRSFISIFLEWIGKLVIIIPSIYLIYKSAGEILSTILAPSEFVKGKKYQIVFTFLAVAPLLFTFVNQLFLKDNNEVGNDKNQFNITSATHYICFQLYFLLANIVASKFLNKFLISNIPEFIAPTIVATKAVSKLLRWHFLGWSSFFLLSFFLPIWILVFTILIVFFNSSLAFLFGRQLGKNKFSRFSIFKTTQGFFWSTLIATFIFSFSLMYIWDSRIFGIGIFKVTCKWIFLVYAIICSALISIVAHLGENTFGLSKRLLGIKNFGRLFGKKIGGFWDRFDGLSIVLFFVSSCFWIIHVFVLGSIGINFSLSNQ